MAENITMKFNRYFYQLQEDFRRKKRMVLFVGAGINATKGKHLLWEDLLRYLFDKAIRYLSIERSLDNEVLDKLKGAMNFSMTGKGNLQEQFELHEFINREFPLIVQASIVKKVLGNSYTSAIQDFFYGQCNKDLLARVFRDNYSFSREKNDGDNEYPFHTLYQLARVILLCPSIEGVVTYNYDNFLTEAIKILYEEREDYFSGAELDWLNRRENFCVHDISGSLYDRELGSNDLFVYHVHGFVPSPSQVIPSAGNEIVLSMEEFYENSREVYSWQTATQLHFFSHYTCLLAGMSLSDMTVQRMLHYASRCGNEDKIYYLHAGNARGDDSHARTYETLKNIKDTFHLENGVVPLFHKDGYVELYRWLGETVSDLVKNGFK